MLLFKCSALLILKSYLVSKSNLSIVFSGRILSAQFAVFHFRKTKGKLLMRLSVSKDRV